MHIPNAKCYLIVRRIFFSPLKVDLETILDLIFPTLGKLLLFLKLTSINPLSKTQSSAKMAHCLHSPKAGGFLGMLGSQWSNQESPRQAEMMGHLDSWIKLCSYNTVKASVVVTGTALQVFHCSISLFKILNEKPMNSDLCD